MKHIYKTNVQKLKMQILIYFWG